ncbi:radical SAM protein [Pseudoflavonifractor sp. 60]|uniref:B12-binding domain-containing radical SAM protein n=1 Tax=Pseudoflavonifractor sp. 60 TaxID=2304576 RepID=UPI001369BCAA|nr:radical SAM protein [Pseudoflavonifractor sp. 60]MCI8914815.1 radical SAM protein [Lawsonibacter sp.]NBI65228.1 radical SAM protein [Pseudoflavonifractor sp. 60]
MRYDSDLLYRPPGEWKSYLLQCTIGCSNNKCTFCGMYKEKKFRIRPVAEILEDIDMARVYYGPDLERVFLMDGDAIIMKTEELLQILDKLYKTFHRLEKVTLYAGPKSTLSKTPEELRTLREAGLSRAYLGVESGSDQVLQFIHKGCTADEMLLAGRRLVEAGIDLWVTIILGMTGANGEGGDWEEHILSTAKMMNAMKPRHLSAMTFAPAKGTPLGEDVLAGRFEVCSADHVLEECRMLIEHLDVDPLHFTSNHASNYLPLKGGLPEDREKFLDMIDQALAGKIRLRKTLNRGI